MSSIDAVHIMVDVIIVDPISIYLILWIAIFCGVAVTIVVQTMDKLYCD